MRKLKKPTDRVEDVFLDCISNIESSDFKKKLQSCISEISCATEEFEIKVETNQLHTIRKMNTIAGIVTKDEMCKVYTDKMAKKSAPGRKYYDTYMALPKNGICPLCGQRVVSTLDHYLPKKKYPTLAVTPSNLVPACKDCNKDKGEKEFENSAQETVHPYFDDIESDVWLYAKIIEENEVAFTFYVQKPESWTDTMYQRVKNHFSMFKLKALYGSHSAEEISSLKGLLTKLYKRTGSNGVSDQLKEYYESNKEVHLNSWKTAMYRALYKSKWFCEEWIEKQ
ncbi:HNH endonuclease [Sporomusa aerivorans]|uniref:HNH endonuclease n=1 Tax=Sporomusa aerivorans TaxID=204936 RepID=UPI00352BB596